MYDKGARRYEMNQDILVGMRNIQILFFSEPEDSAGWLLRGLYAHV